MLSASYHKYRLQFKRPAGTSRGVLYHRDCYFLLLHDTKNPERIGVGECGVLPGLSYDDRPELETVIGEFCDEINHTGLIELSDLTPWPSIRFAIETALLDLASGGRKILFESDFTAGARPISINGLIWMGNELFMQQQLEEKLLEGCRVIKIKVGAIDFDTELKLIAGIRKRYTVEELSIRLDANGAFQFNEAMDKLKKLSEYDIHSVEQPVKQGNREFMAAVCQASPIPIALDEELMGVFEKEEKKALLETIRPQYVILKPSLLGGFKACEDWISEAEDTGAGWWITSALESNIGLNAIAQWTAMLGSELPQGLGTGALYTNNIPCPLKSAGGWLWYQPEIEWNLSKLIPQPPQSSNT